jgi:hypothetical protein
MCLGRPSIGGVILSEADQDVVEVETHVILSLYRMVPRTCASASVARSSAYLYFRRLFSAFFHHNRHLLGWSSQPRSVKQRHLFLLHFCSSSGAVEQTNANRGILVRTPETVNPT